MRYASLLLGVGVGVVLEEHWLGLDLEPAIWKRICCAIIGTAGLIALQWLIKWPISSPVSLAVRDVITGLWATLGAPYVFALCGLYRKAKAV